MSDRHTDAAFSEAEATAFHNGEDVPVRSGHVESASYDQAAAQLHVTFDDGATYAYPCDLPTARGFAVAPSKGGFIWDFFLRGGNRGRKV